MRMYCEHCDKEFTMTGPCWEPYSMEDLKLFNEDDALFHRLVVNHRSKCKVRKESKIGYFVSCDVKSPFSEPYSYSPWSDQK